MALNRELVQSLPTIIGCNVTSYCGWLPSPANPADDPTRDVPLRSPKSKQPRWLVDLAAREYASFDSLIKQSEAESTLKPRALELLESAQPAVSTAGSNIVRQFRKWHRDGRIPVVAKSWLGALGAYPGAATSSLGQTLGAPLSALELDDVHGPERPMAKTIQPDPAKKIDISEFGRPFVY